MFKVLLAASVLAVALSFSGPMIAAPAAGAAQRTLLAAAAASLSHLAPQLADGFRQESGIAVRFNFAGSNTLARQIVEGARVDVFISADASQMDVVERAGRVVPGTRVDVIGNQLVVIATPAAAASVRTPQALASPAVQRVAIGDPEAVPAGVYARQWLERLGLWTAVKAKAVPLPSSPAVLAAVGEGRADTGIVYATDLNMPAGRLSRAAFRVPIDDAPIIRYPAAAIVGSQVAEARRLVDFLRSASAQRIFVGAGFRPLEDR